jgi:hypothetical protein
MTDQQEEIKRGSRLGKIAAFVMVTALLLFAGLYLLLNPILNSPSVNIRISRLLNDNLGQPATVGGIRISGRTLLIHGLTIGNTRGFGGGNLLAVRTIEITPEWGELLAGRKSFAAIRIRELTLTIGKNSAGAWNFTHLAQRIASRKSDAETRIGRLVLENSAVSVNGRGVEDISLSLSDLSTKGSTDSGIHFAFRDKYGNPFQLEGKARLGAKPDLDLKLTAPSLSFKAINDAGVPIDPEKGKGKLILKAGLHGDGLRLACDAAFDRLTVKAKGEDIPLSGTLGFAGQYDLKRDSATLDSGSLKVNGVLRLQVRGRGEQLKKGRLFAFEVSHDGVEIGNLFALLPLKLRHDLLAYGKLLPATFRIAGSGADGMTSASAGFSLRQVQVRRGKRLLLDGVRGDAVLVKGKSGWDLSGKLSQPEAEAAATLRLQDIPFTATFSDRLRPVQAEVPSFTARVAGIPFTGNLSYRAGAPDPIVAGIVMKDAPVAALYRSFPVKGLQLEKGSMNASVRASGTLSGIFRGDAAARLAGLQGKYSGRKISLNEASAGALFSYSGGKPAASGTIKASGGEFDGKKLAASMAYRIADGLLTMSGADISAGRAKLGFAELSGAIPGKVRTAGGGRIPINLRFKGGRCLIDDSGMDAVTGNLHAILLSADGVHRLEGDGAISAPVLAFKGKSVGSLATRVRLSKGKAMAEITGKILDGDLSASASGDPFALEGGSIFALNLKGIKGAGLSEMMGKGYPVRLSGGALDISAKGDYSTVNGLRSRMEISGNGIALNDKNARSIMRGGAVSLDSEWKDGSLIIREGRGAVGKEPEIVLRGTVLRAASAEREGDISLSLPQVPVAALIDAFVNVLPRSLQESTATGKIEAQARIRIKGKKTGVDGEMTLEDGSLEVPSQKLTIASVDGTIPFALDLSGKESPEPLERISFNRGNYSRLLPLLQKGEKEIKGGRPFTIGKVSYGTTEFGTTTLSIRGDNGLTEIRSLQSALFQGTLLGIGFVRYKGGVQYGADILVHDLSLRELCNAYPAIKGYMSGRVDGFVSLYNQGKGLDDLKGFLEFWTRGVKEEKMLVSKEFLQKLAGKKLKGIFFQNDRSYDRGEIAAYLDGGYLTFKTLDISHTNFLGIRDLSVSVAPVQNKINLDHLLTSIREAATRGKAAAGGGGETAAPPATEFKWEE